MECDAGGEGFGEGGFDKAGDVGEGLGGVEEDDDGYFAGVLFGGGGFGGGGFGAGLGGV